MCFKNKPFSKTIGYGLIIFITFKIFEVVDAIISFIVCPDGCSFFSSPSTLILLFPWFAIIFLLAKKVGASSKKEMLEYSFSWFVVFLIIYLGWYLWETSIMSINFGPRSMGSIAHDLVYTVSILFIPLLAVKKQQSEDSSKGIKF